MQSSIFSSCRFCCQALRYNRIRKSSAGMLIFRELKAGLSEIIRSSNPALFVGKEHIEDRNKFVRNILTRLYSCPGHRAKTKHKLRENLLADSHCLLLALETIKYAYGRWCEFKSDSLIFNEEYKHSCPFTLMLLPAILPQRQQRLDYC